MFSSHILGLDIADHSIEFVEFSKSLFSAKPKIVNKARISLEKGVVERGRVINRKLLALTLDALWEKAGLQPSNQRHVVFGVPEHQTYSSVLRLDQSAHPFQKSDIQKIALQTIPLEKDDLIFEYQLLRKVEDKQEILLYGVSREVLQEWSDFFSDAKISVDFFDHELLAIIRGLFGGRPNKNVCIVDIGAERTKIALYSQYGLHYVYALPIAGDFFTQQLAKQLNITVDEAEMMKREKGMSYADIYPTFQKLLEPIIAEVKTALSYFSQYDQSQISNVILVGGSSMLLGLPEYMTEQLKVSVELGSPFLPIPNETKNDHLHYIEALGLALKGIDPRWEKENPSFKL